MAVVVVLMAAAPANRHDRANLTIQMLGGTVGMALRGNLLAATDSYTLFFAVTTGTMLLALAVAWRLVERTSKEEAGS
mgnify:CR=1 FL=1